MQWERQARYECGAWRGYVVLLQWLWGWRGLVWREEQARSPTKSGWDSAVLEGLRRGELCQGLRMLRSFEDSTPINFNPHRLDGRPT